MPPDSLPLQRLLVNNRTPDNWISTSYRIPRLDDTELATKGARRIVEVGLTDVAEGRTIDDFENWSNDKFWPSLTLGPRS